MLHIGIDVHQKPSVFNVFDPAAMKRWRERDYPAIARRAKAERARVTGATKWACEAITGAAPAPGDVEKRR